jgi:hypothetical protein
MPRGWILRPVTSSDIDVDRFVFTPVQGEYPYVMISVSKAAPDPGAMRGDLAVWSHHASEHALHCVAALPGDKVVFRFFAQPAQASYFNETARRIVASLRPGEATGAEASSHLAYPVGSHAPVFRLPSNRPIVSMVLLGVFLLVVWESILQRREERSRMQEADVAARDRRSQQELLAAASESASLTRTREMSKDSRLEALREYSKGLRAKQLDANE